MTPPRSFLAVLTIAIFTFREALRERLIRAMVGMIGLGWFFSLFLNELLLTDHLSSRAAILAFFFRLGSVFLVAVLVSFAVARDLHNRGLDLMLAMPFPRSVIFLGRLSGYFLAALLLAAVCATALLPLAAPGQVVLWGVVLGCELLIVSVVTMVLTLAIQQAPLTLTLTAGFYLLARSMSALLLIAAQAREQVPHWSNQATEWMLQGIAAALPGLDGFTVTGWLIREDGNWQALGPILGETGIYLLLLTAIGLFDLYRKEF
ncbi:MAG: ABC transporter permease [Magnetococcales bacterium]|nr:ABC transporter permease [Magnetococcales bacterium]